MIYNLTREQSAEILWISTRTLDRWVRKWILSHEKRSNKVYLAEEEVKNYTNHKEVDSIVLDTTTKSNNLNKTDTNLSLDTNDVVEKIWKHMDKSMWKFIDLLQDKDKKLEEKNQIIFVLQNKIWEMENKLKNMVALPLYQEEKQELIVEKESLKYEKEQIEEALKKEKIKNIIVIWILVIVVLVLLFVVWN